MRHLEWKIRDNKNSRRSVYAKIFVALFSAPATCLKSFSKIMAACFMQYLKPKSGARMLTYPLVRCASALRVLTLSISLKRPFLNGVMIFENCGGMSLRSPFIKNPAWGR